jgi:predicted RNA-binding protein YlxR (DUF448 family)/ribosomal protein L7Ae-like RNA K-turn-binding protein
LAKAEHADEKVEGRQESTRNRIGASRVGEPERTCVGCRSADAQSALLRFAFADDPPRLAPDPARRLGGRGASVHPRRSCLEQAVRRGGFSRAFKRPVEVETEALIEAASDQYRRRIGGLFLAGWRARHLVIGTDAVSKALDEAKRPVLLVVAGDAAGRRDELEQRALDGGGACITYGDKATLGRLFGRETLGVLGILDEGIAAEVAMAARCVDELSEDR